MTSCITAHREESKSSIDNHLLIYRRKVKPYHLTTFDENSPTLVTSRLLITTDLVKKRRNVFCFCANVKTGNRSERTTVLRKKTIRYHSLQQSKASRVRKRKASLHKSVTFTWIFKNASRVRCFHDGSRLDTTRKVSRKTTQIFVHIQNVSQTDAGLYWCQGNEIHNPTYLNSIIEFRISGWSVWYPWLPCSAGCGTGRKMEMRKCLGERKRHCKGMSVREVTCSSTVGCMQGISAEIIPSVLKQQANGSAVNVTCSVYQNKREFEIELVCRDNHGDGFRPRYKIHDRSFETRISADQRLYRKTFEVIVDRNKSSHEVKIFCHCKARSTRDEMLKTSGTITLITFPSVATTTRDAGMTFRVSPSKFATVEARPEADSQSSVSSLPVIVATTLGIALLLLLTVFVIGYVKINKIQIPSSPSSRQASCENFIDSPHLSPDSHIYKTPPITFFQGPDASGSTKSGNPVYDTTDPVYDTSDSVFHRDGSSKSNTSKFSSVSAGICPRPDFPDTINQELCAWGRFTERGGRLTIKGTGVQLYIPSRALPKGTSQMVYIGLMNEKGEKPELQQGEAFLSPAVVCGPDGLEFDKPVYLTVPHNAVLDEGWNPQVQSCPTNAKHSKDSNTKHSKDSNAKHSKDSNAKHSEGSNWQILHSPDMDAPFSEINDKSMQIMIDHFTNYIVVGAPSSDDHRQRIQLKSWIVAFFTKPKVDRDCTVRVYCIPATDAAFQELENMEMKINGVTSDSRKLLRIVNNNSDLLVKASHVKDGWSAITDEKCIPFQDIWQCLDRFPNVTFVFERKRLNEYSFTSIFDVKQNMDNSSSVQVTCSVQVPRSSSSSGYLSDETGCDNDIQYKIPVALRRELCLLLDPLDEMTFNDWRHFAEKLGCSKNFIRRLKGRQTDSPTDHLIEWWEFNKSTEIPLKDFVRIFNEIERLDVAQVVEKFLDC